MSDKPTLFLSKSEIKTIKNFYNELGVNPSHLFDFTEGGYANRYYTNIIGDHETIQINEDGIRIIGLGTFYTEDEE